MELLAAVRNGHEDTVALLLGHGADLTETTCDARHLFHLACIAGDLDLLGHVINVVDSDAKTPLHYAAEWGDLDWLGRCAGQA
ncbi:hypothetical protein DRE_02141 [Drechslerella stenobrocha 248]|uniref:Uncharacterized protein n=1 Tax=Drechslerella stenobrocha 248 TaxID=1043628 RepID=W7I8H3_9PEZI|nr:hypothetical protein DRE_02141 [Drechslerella stenobrocha 248]